MARTLRILLGCLCAALPFSSALAQEFKFQPEVDTIPVQINDVAVHSPFTGGFSFSKSALIDIDDDADLDLFLGELFGTITFYRNTGTAANPLFTLEDRIFASIDVGAYNAPAFTDIDNDGDFDLFAGEDAGNLNFFRNSGTATDFAFTLETENFDSVAVGNFSAPAFADIDNDGDVDLFMGEKNGGLKFFRNTGDAGSPKFIKEAQRLDSLNVGNDSAPGLADIDNDGDFDLFLGEDGGNINFHRNNGTASEPKFELDTENFAEIRIGNDSAPAFADLDGDDDVDLLVTEFLGNVNFYRNAGSSSEPALELEIENFATLDLGANSVPTFVDIDNDGDQDLFAGKNSGSINFYRNTGSKASPAFNLETENLPSSAGPIDVGSFSICAFGDIDSDGDFDLFVGEFDGNINFYRNSGSAAEPVFTIEAQSLAGFDVGSNSAPALADIDGDADLDLFVGKKDGKIIFYRNTGKAIDSTFVLEATTFAGINVQDNAVPAFVDKDGDGDLDLFVGKDRGNISYYRNESTTTDLAFTLQTGSLASIDIGNNSAPALVDIDDDQDLDLFVGEKDGGLYFFRRIPGTTGVTLPEEEALPQAFELSQNYPNPFNPETKIEYSLPNAAVVKLAVYNLLGQRVATLVDQRQSAGIHSIFWNGKDDLGRSVASGIYLYRLEISEFVKARQLILIR